MLKVINVFILQVVLSALDMFLLNRNWQDIAIKTLESKRQREYALNRLFAA